MLRIVFTGEDIARLTIRPPDPLWDMVLSIHMLRGQPGDLLFGDWRRSTVGAVRGRLGRGGRLLGSLTPTMGYFPDFLNPAAAANGLEHGLEAIRSTPVAVLGADLDHMSRSAPPAAEIRSLYDGDPATLTLLTGAMQTYYERAIAPYQSTLESAAANDRRVRANAMLTGGVEELLRSYRPMITFSGRELRVPGHADQVIHLEGRGLVLVPSFFCVRHPVTLFDGDLPPTLVYPCLREQEVLRPQSAPSRSLAALIGGTRAAILATVGAGTGTVDLARRLRISAASASEHAKVLRDAGLITSNRIGPRVEHETTKLGLALLSKAVDAVEE